MWLPLSFPPIIWATAMVGNRKDLNFVTNNNVDDRIGEVLHDKTTLPMAPWCAKLRMLQQQLNRVLEFSEKRQRKCVTGALLIVLCRVLKVSYRLRVKRISH